MKCSPAFAAMSSNLMVPVFAGCSCEEWPVRDGENTRLERTLKTTIKNKSRMLSLEPRPLHPALRFLILHECFPDQARPLIFRHHHRNAQVDAEHVGVVPIRQRIECVHQAVPSPSLGIALADR